MNIQEIKKIRTAKRVKRTRSKVIKISRLNSVPRLTVFRSNKHFSAQIIDDSNNKTLVSASEKELEIGKKLKSVKSAELGSIIAQKAQKSGIKKVIFDKGAYKYHGRVKSFADTARKGGLIF